MVHVLGASHGPGQQDRTVRPTSGTRLYAGALLNR
jgi:hypothetical protein